MEKEFKIGETTIKVKGLKAEIEKITEPIKKLIGIKSYMIEKTGIIGGEEREPLLYVMFGQNELRNPEEYETKKADFLKFVSSKVLVMEDYQEINKRAKEIFDAHVFIEDRRKTPEQQEAYRIEINKLHEEAKIKREQENEQTEKAKAELIKEYPYLVKKPSALSDRILATRNLRIELERAFPGHKFSITSETFSGGDSIDVRWEDGALYDDVNKIVKKYQEGHFDGMTDMYEYSNKPFCSLFGGTKYTNSSRKVNQDRYLETAEKQGYKAHYDRYELVVDDENLSPEEKHRAVEKIRELTNETSFYVKPSKIEASAGVSNVNFEVTFNPDKEGIEIKFPSKPETKVLDLLKANNFRWGKYNKVWYKSANRVSGDTSEDKCIYVSRLLSGDSSNNQDQITNPEEGLETQSYQGFERELQQESRSEREY